MAEMDMDAFEARFAERLATYAAIPVAPIDADSIAHEVVGVRPGPRGSLRLVGLRVPAVAWVLLALATAVAAGLIAGALLHRLAPTPRPSLVLATETGLYLGEPGEGTQSGLTLLRDDGSFIGPRWSPNGTLIAVIHGPPIPPQPGTEGALPLTPALYRLVATDLLVLRPDGTTAFAFPGAVAGFAWAPIGADGASLLAVQTASGEIAVLDAGGRRVGGSGARGLEIDRSLEATLLPPRLVWASPTVLLFADARGVSAMDVASPDKLTTVVGMGSDAGPDDRVTALAVTPDGSALALLVAPCDTGCDGEVRFARLPREFDGSAEPGPDGRSLAAIVGAATSLSWQDDGEHVLAWPLLASSGDRATRLAASDGAVDTRDVVAAWTRRVADGSSRTLVVTRFSAFNDRHFDAWLMAADGSATRIGERSLGADLRPTSRAGSAP